MTAFYGWRLLGVVLLINIINAGFPPYVAQVLSPYMTETMKLDRATLGLVFSVFMLNTGMWGPLTALGIGRFGVRRMLIAGSLLIATGSFLMAAVVDTGLEAIVGYGVFVGLGVGIGGMLTSQACVARWFNRRRTFALSTVIAAVGIGGVVAAPIVSALTFAFDGDWRAGWWLLFALALVAAALSVLFVREWPADLGQVPDGAIEDTKTGTPSKGAPHRPAFVPDDNWSLGEILRQPVMWLTFAAAISLSSGLAFAGAHGLINLHDLNFTPAMVTLWLSCLTAAKLAGTLGAGVLGNRMPPNYLWLLFMLMLGAGCWLSVAPQGTIALLASALLLGLGIGGGLTSVMTLPGAYFGARIYPSLIGMLTPVLTISGALASYGGGRYYDMTGSYAGPYYLLAAMAMLSAVALVAARPPHRREQAAGARSTAPRLQPENRP